MADQSSSESGSYFEIPSCFVRQLIEHARQEAPRECCGLIGGWGSDPAAYAASNLYPLVNESESEREFFAAEGLFDAQRLLRQREETLVAIYHSHPAAPAVPSQLDLQRNYYPNAVHLIISLAYPVVPEIRAYRLFAEHFEEVPIRITGD